MHLGGSTIGEFLKFEGNGNQTVYNPSIPFPDDGRTILLARLESLDIETDSRVAVFERYDDTDSWTVDERSPIFTLQDPFYCGRFDNPKGNEPYQVFGGVSITVESDGSISNWRTAFYRYTGSIRDMKTGNAEPKPFAIGPNKMKDIRIIQLPEGEVGVFTRPQGEFGGPGRIGYTTTDNLDNLEGTLAEYDQARDETTLIPNLFQEAEWGGANHLELLPDGTIGVLSHRAYYVDTEGVPVKDYEATYFTFDPTTRKTVSPIKTIATAEAFPPIKPKFGFLRNVLFPAGLERDPNGTCILYAGIGDVATGKLLVVNPSVN